MNKDYEEKIEEVSNFNTNNFDNEDSFRNESNPNPNFYNKIFETQVKNPFDKFGSFKDTKLEKNVKNYLKKNIKYSSQGNQIPGHHRSQSVNVLY